MAKRRFCVKISTFLIFFFPALLKTTEKFKFLTSLMHQLAALCYLKSYWSLKYKHCFDCSSYTHADYADTEKEKQTSLQIQYTKLKIVLVTSHDTATAVNSDLVIHDRSCKRILFSFELHLKNCFSLFKVRLRRHRS